MIQRTGHLLLRLVAGLAAGLVVLVLLLALRLERGPVAVNFLAPAVAAALAGNHGAVVAIDHASLGLDAGPKLEILARGVHVTLPGQGPALTLPQLAIDLSPGALLRGVIAPTRIALSDPVLRLERDAAGSFHLGLGAEEGAISDELARRVLGDLSGPASETATFGALTDIDIERARLIVDDRALGVVWRADDAELHVHRDNAGLRGALRLAVVLGGRRTQIDGVVLFQRADDRLTASLTFDGLRLMDWAAAAPALAPLAALDFPVSGTLRATLDPTRFTIADAAAVLVLGPGQVRQADLPNGAIAISGGLLAASYDPGAGSVTLDRFALDLGGPRVSISGTVTGVGADLLEGALPKTFDLAAKIAASDLPTNEFQRLWPERLGPVTRAWVTQHVHDGTVDRIAAQLAGHLDLTGAAPRPFTVTALAGTLAFHGLAVDYFKPLPPVRAVAGTATFDRATLVFTPTGGALKGVKVEGGTVRLFQLDTHDEQIAIDLALEGPIKDALAVLDHDPLHYAHAVSIDPAQVGGSFKAQVSFAFPLVHDLMLSQVRYTAAATLADASVGDVLFGRDLDQGQFRLRLDRAAMRLDGTATLAGVPVTLRWTQNLARAAPVETRYQLAGTLDGAARRALGLDLVPGAIAGPVKFAVDYARAPSHKAQAQVTLDLGAARLDLGLLDWTKPAGMPATAQLVLSLADERLVAIPSVVVSGGGIDARLGLRFAAAGVAERLEQVDVTHLVAGKTDIAGTIRRRAEGGWRITLAGPSLDAAGLMKEAQGPPAAKARQPPLVVEAKLGRLWLAADRMASAVSGSAYSDGVHWQSATIDAKLAGGGTLRLRYGSVAGDRKFNLITDDFGAFLRLIDLSDNIRGGRFQLAGTVVDEGAHRVLQGTIDGANYRLVDAPLFARLLSVASFSGIASLLRGQGIPFSRLSGDVTYRGASITVDNLRAYGGAIGVNASGSVDRAAQTIDVSGTLVPAYALNSVLGNIPVLGDLLMGGKGEGLFGANFRVAGPLADPGVSVNPLSALAPGVLRKLFLFQPGNPTPPPTAAHD